MCACYNIKRSRGEINAEWVRISPPLINIALRGMWAKTSNSTFFAQFEER